MSLFRSRLSPFRDKVRFQDDPDGQQAEYPPQNELYSIEQLARHGEAVARIHELDYRPGKDRLLPRLDRNKKIIDDTYRLISSEEQDKNRLSPAAVWLLDNYYLVAEQIWMVRRHLPRGYSLKLPRLKSGPSAGFPRVFDLVRELISHVDGRVDAGSLGSIVAAYQNVHTLELGELWAIPIMLRLALIDNLRVIASHIASGRRDRLTADEWAQRMLKAAGENPNAMIIEMAEMVRSDVPMSCTFVGEFFRKLQRQNPALFMPLNWVERRLAEKGQTIEGQVQLDSQRQASLQISISNSINSLRFLSAIDWKCFVEDMSRVEQVLREDPAGVYPRMDFATRDRYRHAVEKISRQSRMDEVSVARKAVALAASGENGIKRFRHVGYYLADRGLRILEKNCGMRPTAGDLLSRFGKSAPLFFYLGSILVLTAGLTFVLTRLLFPDGGWKAAMASVLLSLGFSQMAVSLVNWISGLFVRPEILPRMDFSAGVPPESATLVTVPSMLSGERHVAELVNKIEVTYLANRRERVYFSLLTDFTDASEKTMPQDQRLVELARSGIRRLNEKYGTEGRAPFLLFHRPRLWNPAEKKWMGYERKRGKLEALNAAILSGQPGELLLEGDPDILNGIRYVITLDTDTRLPHDSALKLIETMSHPLNEPVFDPVKGRVTAGYAILQPRVVSSLTGTRQSAYSRLFGSESGIDPYTRAVSDVYQDLFGEGSFVGKGIYHVAMFDRVLSGQLPENRILSHDLLEGCYVRSGLVSDVQMTEEFPGTYSEDMARRHRWIRGDWQIASWLGPVVPGFGKRMGKNPLSALSRWKNFDNLRRSLVPIALFLTVALGWFFAPVPWIGLALAAGILILPLLPGFVIQLFRVPERYPVRLHLLSVVDTLNRHVTQALFSLAVLPYEAVSNMDAVLRTAWRTIFSGKRLLEWTTSGEAKRKAGRSVLSYFRLMFGAPFLAAALAGVMHLVNRPVPPQEWAVLVLWFASPLVCWLTGRPLKRRREKLSEHQSAFLRTTARKTWRFFETFAGPEDNWLPPDNYQEDPAEILTHMTSPTNIGLMVLSNLGAYDLGYLTAGQLIDRTKKTFKTLSRMERFRGHFFNWYDTRTLQPLNPRYISTVDSGNLAGFLFTVQTGLLEIAGNRIFQSGFYSGLGDTLSVAREYSRAMAPDHKSALEERFGKLRQKIRELEKDSPGLSRILRDLSGLEDRARRIREEFASSLPDDAAWWLKTFETQCESQREDILFLAPWLALTDQSRLPDAQTLDWLDANATLDELAGYQDRFNGTSAAALEEDFLRAVRQGSHRAASRRGQLEQMSVQCQKFAEHDYDFLYDPSRNLLSIGYEAGQHRRDDSYYDLLASEARLASFIGISRGQLPLDHWFSLGRLVTIWKGKTILMSWGGSMFEYLMPQLVMPGYEETLIGQSCQAVVDKQISYCGKQGVPWGVSESAENVTDANLKYQYRSFGIPEIGFKRGLADDLVIAPYASLLAVAVRPRKVCVNLQKMKAGGYEGRYGFYESVDFTESRLGQDRSEAVIRSFMAHHQGMSFVSLVNFFTGERMVRRFRNHTLFQTAVLLLQERIPQAPPFRMWHPEPPRSRPESEERNDALRVFDTAQTPSPEVHLLSNGRYHVMVTNGGGGYSRWHNLSLTRWSGDVTRDNEGSFVYVRDLGGESTWSAAFQPALAEPNDYEVVFSQARAEFKRRDQGLDTYTEIAVSPEDDIEYRRVTVSNYSVRTREMDVTSYAEVSLMDGESGEHHPVFDKLFVRTEILREHNAILCSRRPRSPEEKTPWMFHLLVHPDQEPLDVSFETDRMRFIGRGRSVHCPRALEDNGPLSGAQGSVLDPVISVRCRFKLRSVESKTFGFITGIAETREGAVSLIEKYKDRRLADRVFDIALIHGRVVLQQINASEADAQLFGKLAGAVIYPCADRRAGSDVLMKNTRGQSALWAYGISGDLPIVLLRIGDHNRIDLAAQLIQAHVYWRLKGLKTDLVIWNEERSGYRQDLQDRIMGLITTGSEASHFDRPGGIFIRFPDQMTEEDRVLMLSSARVIVTDSGGNLASQVRDRVENEMPVHKMTTARDDRASSQPENFRQTSLAFHNGLGGFTRDGREYIFQVFPDSLPPMPWVNVVANRRIGSVISQSGGTTWYENAHEFRLTPWYNDPVCDTSGETIYIRDENSGKFWSATPLPAPASGDYLNRHGLGYSVFEYTVFGIKTELWVYVDPDAPVKYFLLKARNDSQMIRRLSATCFLELVLGDRRSKTQMHVRTEKDHITGALFATNPFHADFSGRVVFLDSNETRRSESGDRTEFIGRNGTLSDPAAMHRAHLSGRVGAGFDPAMSMQVFFDLEAGQEKEIVFVMGAGRDAEEARRLVSGCRSSLAAYQARDRVWHYWNHTLGTINVETPDPALNFMTNGWLTYQVMTSRFFGRCGYYQSGGAFGFRDQLQDVTALLFSEPGLVREHLLLSASRQFREGDVQHWWHPPLGRGVRTLISDDYLWLPFVTALYVKKTGDTGVLDETVPFLESRPLNPGDDSLYDLPVRSDETATLYEHCRRAVERAFRYGRHALPLMSGGDWNDGMNLVGFGGSGESVWLGFFLYAVLGEIISLARMRGDDPFAGICEEEAAKLKTALDAHGWDGEWYRRAYFDDGTPLGSRQNTECRIDAIAQSWAVLSGAAPEEKMKKAMESLEKMLVDRRRRMIMLLDPPFNNSLPDPGYIKGYVPGVRENGGQYTHAAVWAVMAFARLGEKEKVKTLLSLINPVHHGSTKDQIAIYKVEPYVMAADIYSSPSHPGRGGWTWYTGSAAWMYRLITESVLGLDLRVDRLYFKPCLPPDWGPFKIHYRYRETVYHLEVTQVPGGRPVSVTTDGSEQPEEFLPLTDDRMEHSVQVEIGV